MGQDAPNAEAIANEVKILEVIREIVEQSNAPHQIVMKCVEYMQAVIAQVKARLEPKEVASGGSST